MKKTISLLLALVLSVSMAGCAGQSPDASSQSVEASSSQAETSSTAAETVPTGEVLFWDMVQSDAYLETAQGLCEKFSQENPTIKLTYQSIPWDGYVQNFTTAIASGAGPDMSTGGGSMQHLFAAMGEILPLDPIIDEWKEEGKLDDFDPIALSLIRFNGKQIGIPWQYDPRMLWQNTEAFAKAGITELPKDLESFRQTLITLKNSGVKNPFIISGTDHFALLSFWQMIAFQFGGGLMKDGQIIVDSPESIKAFAYIKQLMDDGLIPKDIAGWNANDTDAQFLQGNGAIAWGTGDMSVKAQNQAADMVDKIAILPRVTDKTINPANSIMAYSKTKNPEATLYTLKWWSENNESLFTDGQLNKIPVRKSFMENPAIGVDATKKAIMSLVIPNSVGNGFPNAELYPQYQVIMGNGVITEAMQKMLLSGATPESVAAEAKVQIQQILET